MPNLFSTGNLIWSAVELWSVNETRRLKEKKYIFFSLTFFTPEVLETSRVIGPRSIPFLREVGGITKQSRTCSMVRDDAFSIIVSGRV